MLREFRTEPKGFPDLLNYYALVHEGVMFQKDGSLLSGWWYAGPDMESATPNEMAVLSAQINGALRDLGNGWMIQADAIRKPAPGYPEAGAFPDATSALVDLERRRLYESGAATFESVYALTATYLPPPEIQGAFRARIAEHHPDRVATLGAELQELALARSKEITAAYAALRR
jgi:type IV secretory pathway VirB4 component